jgi:hypothetical protein
VHQVGDGDALARHLTLLQDDRALLARRLDTAPGATWTAAGRRLLEAYRETLADAAWTDGQARPAA